jgi:hypothetical protein
LIITRNKKFENALEIEFLLNLGVLDCSRNSVSKVSKLLIMSSPVNSATSKKKKKLALCCQSFKVSLELNFIIVHLSNIKSLKKSRSTDQVAILDLGQNFFKPL